MVRQHAFGSFTSHANNLGLAKLAVVHKWKNRLVVESMVVRILRLAGLHGFFFSLVSLLPLSSSAKESNVHRKAEQYFFLAHKVTTINCCPADLQTNVRCTQPSSFVGASTDVMAWSFCHVSGCWWTVGPCGILHGREKERPGLMGRKGGVSMVPWGASYSCVSLF